MKIELYLGVTGGKVDNPEAVKEALKHFEGKRFKMILTNDKKRSNQQNRYERGVIDKTIGDWLRAKGNDVTDDDVHEFLTKKYLPVKTVTIDGKDYERQIRFSDLTTEQFTEVKEKIQRDFSQLGLVVADPHQEEFL